MVWALLEIWYELCREFFLEFPEKFQNSYVKEQSYFHATGTLEETDWLLKT